MTAYELAYFIDKYCVDNTSKEAAILLRQQADRIAELENKLSFYEIKDLDSGLKPKPLSDEEIVKEWSKFYPDVFHTHLIDFVRVIEERHGIK